MFKKLIAIFFVSMAIVAIASSDVVAQPFYGTMCCDIDPVTGGARYRCGIVNPTPVGNPCVCPYVAGTGFVCR